jgi:uncharacterized protein YaiI (UPF0178 family)
MPWRLAKQCKIPVTMLMDTSHMLSDGYSTVITVDTEADSVDFALMGILKREDIVVTQDYGLAAMVIGKGAKAVNQNGLVFTNDNMDKLLMERHINAKVRRGGGRTKGAPKRTKDDDARFEAVFVKILEEIAPQNNDAFDYTEWQRNLWNDKSIEEIHDMAIKHEQKSD